MSTPRSPVRGITRSVVTVRGITDGKGGAQQAPPPDPAPDKALVDRFTNELIDRFGDNLITRV